MSTRINRAIVVSSGVGDELELAHEKAAEMFGYVSPISPCAVNGIRAFFIPPDGSKEGWDECLVAKCARENYKAWLRTHANDDGGSSIEWVEVSFGRDVKEARVIDHGGIEVAPLRKGVRKMHLPDDYRMIEVARSLNKECYFQGSASKEYLQKVQLKLTALGYECAGDGCYGDPQTASAIKRFQAENGLPVSGWLDLETLTALDVQP